MKILLVVLYIILSVTGMALIKKGGNAGTLAVNNGNFNFGISLISLVGFICYIGSFLLFTQIIVRFDLSYITPICTGIVQILTLVASYFIFKEQISWQTIVGASMIIIGIIVMNFKTQ